jgi:ribosome-binding protein aMBF1 (putative translation factor)
MPDDIRIENLEKVFTQADYRRFCLAVTVGRAQQKTYMSQMDLAHKSNVAFHLIRMIERETGNPTYKQMEAIATALGTTVEEMTAPPTPDTNETIAARANAPDSDFIDADALHRAIAERDA